MALSSPSTPPVQDNPLRCTLLEMRERLLSLYSALITAEQLTYERIHGHIESPDELLHLVLHDSWFTWLCPVLDLLVRIDQLLSDNACDLTQKNLGHLITAMRSVIRPSVEGDGFERAYYEAIQRTPEAVLAHFQVTRILLAEAA